MNNDIKWSIGWGQRYFHAEKQTKSVIIYGPNNSNADLAQITYYCGAKTTFRFDKWRRGNKPDCPKCQKILSKQNG